MPAGDDVIGRGRRTMENRHAPDGLACHKGENVLELVLPTAIGTQLATLTQAERSAMISRLQLLAADPDRLGSDVVPSPSDRSLWMVRLSGRMLALVHAEESQLKV